MGLEFLKPLSKVTQTLRCNSYIRSRIAHFYSLRIFICFQRSDRGVVYLSHIPHGFYDEQIEGFFGQFGKVTQVSVPKGKVSMILSNFKFVRFVKSFFSYQFPFLPFIINYTQHPPRIDNFNLNLIYANV